MSTGSHQDLPESAELAGLPTAMPDFGGYIVNRLFAVGLKLELAHRLTGEGGAGNRIALASDEVDQLIRDIRATLLGIAADAGKRLTSDHLTSDRPTSDRPTSDRVTRDRLTQTARELEATALRTVAFLERQGDAGRQPSRIDYPAEIKRWQAFAHHAEEMAKRWEQQP